MNQSVSTHFAKKLIDWLIAVTISIVLFWFIITQPVYIQEKEDKVDYFSVDKLKQHVQRLTTKQVSSTIDTEKLFNNTNYIFNEFSRHGRPKYQLIHSISRRYNNIYLQLGPTTEEFYVIGAHYEATEHPLSSERNASGIATLIELARHLSLNKKALKMGVILIAYPTSLNETDNVINTGSYLHAL